VPDGQRAGRTACRTNTVDNRPVDVEEAVRTQEELRRRLVLTDEPIAPPRTVTGLDISYEVGSDRAVAAAVVLDAGTAAVVEVSLVEGRAPFPYVHGLLAFREVPLLLDAVGRLRNRPEVLMCDGFGIAHPRRFGLACHLGVLLDVPTFGVAKNSTYDEPGPNRGDWSPMVDDGDVVGRALRTQNRVKPVFVSPGHRLGLEDATTLTLALSRKYRIPEPTRQADIRSREALRTGTARPASGP
jgi:deoxyribonuclease V